MLELHHNQHFKGFYNWAIKFTSAREGGWGKRENYPISLGTVPPSSDQFFTIEILVQNKALRSCYASAQRNTWAQTHTDKAQVLLWIFCSAQCKTHNLTVNSSRNINSNCRWTFTTNYFQGQVKLNTMHLFKKNRISTRDWRWMVHGLDFSSLVSDFGLIKHFLNNVLQEVFLTLSDKTAIYF